MSLKHFCHEVWKPWVNGCEPFVLLVFFPFASVPVIPGEPETLYYVISLPQHISVGLQRIDLRTKRRKIDAAIRHDR